jgi:hypothetical protein
VAARPVQAAPATREESFEMEAPFAGRRLHAAEPPSRPSLEFDDNLEAIDATLDGTLDETLDVRAAPPPAASNAARASPELPAFAPPPVPLPPAAPAPAAEPGRVAGAAEPPPLASPTLAELYVRQGFVDKAIEVYQQLLQREPDNQPARARMLELLAPPSPPASPAASVPPRDAPREERAARRRDIERTIARLEELLATVRRHAPAGRAK